MCEQVVLGGGHAMRKSLVHKIDNFSPCPIILAPRRKQWLVEVSTGAGHKIKNADVLDSTALENFQHMLVLHDSHT